MVQAKELFRITKVTDCDTGIYQVGELDYSMPIKTMEWLGDPESGAARRESLAKWLRWLADRTESGGFNWPRNAVDQTKEGEQDG